MYKVLRFLILVVIFSACIPNYNNKKIELKPKKSSVSPNVFIDDVIKLESSDEALVGEISSIKFYKEYIYVFDQNISKTLFLFDRNGSFIKKIKRGKGPGELFEPWDFIINQENNTIEVWDQMTFQMKRYNLTLDYIDAKYSKGLAVRNMKKINEEEYFIFSQFYVVDSGMINKSELYDYLIYDKNLYSLQQRIKKSDPRTLLETLDSPIAQINDTIYFLSPYDYNIYEFKNNSLRSLLYLDFGMYKPDDDDITNGYRFLKKRIQQGKKIGYLENLFMNKSYVTVSYRYLSGNEFVIIDRKMKSVVNSFDLYKNSLLPKLKIKGIDDNGKFIGVSDAADFMNFNELKKEKINNEIHTLDNQVILIFSLRNS